MVINPKRMLNMNYQRIYDEIIERAKLRGLNRKKLEGYFERHHIIPRCMKGTNDKSNLILLTGREHYICHYLLWKLDRSNSSLALAFHMMIYKKNDLQQRDFKISSKQYEMIRTDVSYNMKRRIISEETKKRMSNSHKGKLPWNSGTKGMSRGWTLVKHHSIDVIEKMRISQTGKILSSDTKHKISNNSPRNKHIRIFNNDYTSITNAYKELSHLGIITCAKSSFIRNVAKGLYV